MATIFHGETPRDYAEPDWQAVRRTHEWKRYISEELRMMWHQFTPEQRAAIARMAQGQADAEDWD